MTGGGYDHLVQYGGKGAVESIFKFTGAARGAWSWEYLQPLMWNADRHQIEWAIPLDILGLEAESGVRLQFQTLGPGVRRETWGHQSESMVSTYTLAAPAPEAEEMPVEGDQPNE